jgi:Pyridoxamine 5'-phosphate oxidase
VSRRDQIRMSDDEVRAFLDEERTVTCATNGPRGWPHLMPLWFVVRAGELWSWTYAKSQKAINLERDPRATLQVETGTDYDQLRGVMLEADAVLHREADDVAGIGVALFERMAGQALGDEVRAMVTAQAPKRVALQFVERRRVSWDHRKLATGVY